MKKQTVKKLLALAMATTIPVGLVACGGGPSSSDRGNKPVDTTKSQLHVYNFDGGIGTDWLYDTVERFEEAYAEVSFENGKKGIQVQVGKGKSSLDAIASSPYSVFFTEQVLYNDLIAQNLLLDISDVVSSPLSTIEGCEETGAIADKITAEQTRAITAVNGKWYVLPHYECYTGVTYDRALFHNKNLFIKEGGGWTNLEGELSVGADGIRNTSDDGLPSSYEEFYNLIDRMLLYTIVPFIYTGQYATYTNNLVTGLWASYTGKEEFMLNTTYDSTKGGTLSGEDVITTEIITGFNGNTPIIEEKTIDAETGYLLSQQAGKYYALSFLQKILGDSRYFSDTITGVLSHLDAQTNYIYSSLENKPIAMIIEGSYWYNEARESLASSVIEYQADAEDRDFAFMPLPRQLTGQVQEGEGRRNALYDALSSFAFINGNIKGNEAKTKMAKTFLQFCYTDQELLGFTKSTSIFKAVEYNVEESDITHLSKYAKSVYKLRKEADVIHPYSDHPIFINNQSDFSYHATGTSWASTVNGQAYNFPYQAFKDNKNAKDYFQGLAVSSTEWAQQFGKYFD